MKTLRVTFNDGSQYDIPAKVITDNIVAYYRRNFPDRPKTKPDDDWDEAEDICDWATNNMNWCDVAPHAVQVKPPAKRDMDELWANCDTEVVTTPDPTS